MGRAGHQPCRRGYSDRYAAGLRPASSCQWDDHDSDDRDVTYRVHALTCSDTFDVPDDPLGCTLAFEHLVVGGGGACGGSLDYARGGRGGAGGVLLGNAVLTSGLQSVTVGQGGSGGNLAGGSGIGVVRYPTGP